MLCLFCVSSGFAYTQQFGSLRNQAMGGAGVALADDPISFYMNPASLYFQEEGLFLISGSHGDRIAPSAFKNGEPVPLLQEPVTGFGALFSSRFLALSLELQYSLIQRDDSLLDSAGYVALNASKIQLNAAYGWRNISLGFFARGGNVLKRTNINISRDSPFIDYFKQTYFEQYRDYEDQFFSTGAGFLITYQWISMGFVTQSLFEMDYASNELVLEMASVFDKLAIGIAFSTPMYNVSNELNLLALSLVMDVSNIGDDEQRLLSLGAEMNIQLLPEYSVSLRAGYRERRTEIASIFTLNGDLGHTTYGIGARINRFEVEGLVEVPLSFYQGDFASNLEAIGVKLGISLVL
jgi:hypothetical protein